MISSYERIALRLLMSEPPRRRPYVRFINGVLLRGTQSLHRTRSGRMWRMFWRIKQVRPRT